jgi:hypothetical protein
MGKKMGIGDMLLGVGSLLAVGLGVYWWKKGAKPPEEEPPPDDEPTPADIRLESLVISPTPPIAQATAWQMTALVKNYGETDGTITIHLGYDRGDANSNVGNPQEFEATTLSVPGLGSASAVHSGTTAAYGGSWWMWAKDDAGNEKRALLTVAD